MQYTESQTEKLTSIEQWLVPITNTVIEIRKKHHIDVRKDVYEYFIGRSFTFRELNVDRTIAISNMVRRNHLYGEGSRLLTESIENIETFLKDVKQFESSENIVLSNKGWIDYFKEKFTF